MVKQLGRRETAAIGVVAMVAVILGGWFILISPASSQVAALKQQTNQQQQDSTSLRTQIAVLNAGKAKLPVEQSELAKLSQKVPASAALPTLLRQMQTLAKDTGIRLQGITPTLPQTLTNAAGIEAVGVTLTVAGGYSELEQYLNGLESLSRAFLVSNVSLNSAGTAASTSSSTSSSPSASSSSSAAPNEITATFTGRVLLRTPATTTAAG